jgi:hypothetical protein
MTLRFIFFKTSEPQNLPEADKFRRVDSLVQRRHRVLLSLFFKLTEYIIRCWAFNVRCSMFNLLTVPAMMPEKSRVGHRADRALQNAMT